MSPTLPVIYDPSAAAACAQAARIRDIIDVALDCGSNRCWLGTRAAFEAADLRTGEHYAPW